VCESEIKNAVKDYEKNIAKKKLKWYILIWTLKSHQGYCSGLKWWKWEACWRPGQDS